MSEQPDEVVIPEDEVDDELSLLDPDHVDDDDVEDDDLHAEHDEELLPDE